MIYLFMVFYVMSNGGLLDLPEHTDSFDTLKECQRRRKIAEASHPRIKSVCIKVENDSSTTSDKGAK